MGSTSEFVRLGDGIDGAVLFPLLCEFLREKYEEDILQLLRNVSDEQCHHGVLVSLTELGAWNMEVAEKMLNNVAPCLEVFDTALLSVQNDMMQHILSEDGANSGMCSVKENVHIRLFGPPGGLRPAVDWDRPMDNRTMIRSELIDSLVTVTGTVAKTGVVKVLESRKLFQCTACGYTFAVVVDDFSNEVSLPKQCPSGSSRHAVSQCLGTKYIQRPATDKSFTNYQEIQLQETGSSTTDAFSGGNQPTGSRKAIVVILQDDLADSCQIGEVLHITGVVIKHSSSTAVGQKAIVTLALKAISVVNSEKCIRVGDVKVHDFAHFWQDVRHRDLEYTTRDMIVNSFCPMLSGMYAVKLSVLLMLLGGTAQTRDVPEVSSLADHLTNSDPKYGQSSRSEIHLLLVGDPGTGKSQIQKYVTNVAHKAIITNGSSTSAAGLTAAAVKENGQWTLEAGALVLANGGVCCIDEIDCLKQAESSSLHEAMEQQTCSIAKAGLVSTLPTKVSVFGTCNPKGNVRIDPKRALKDQLQLSSPLLSRFDIILLLLDDMSPSADAVIVDHVLAMRGHTQPPSPATQHDAPDAWRHDKIKDYIDWCRNTFHPQVNKAAKDILIAYYQKRRSLGADHVTVRFFESLLRLSQAHAKLMARYDVQIEDAIVAICLADASVSLSDERIFEIPPSLRIAEMGYFMNQDSPEKKAREIQDIIMNSLGFDTMM